MKVFLFALAVCAASLPYGMSDDSSAVAAATAAHWNAVRRAELLIANAATVDKQENHSPVQETTQHQLGVNVQDTPEVAAAKDAHFEAVRKAEHAIAVANATSRYQPEVHVPSGSHGHHSSPAHHQLPVHHHHPTSVHYPTYVHNPVHHTGYYPSHDHHITPTYHPDHVHHSYPSYHHHHVSGGHYYPVHTYSAPVVQTTQHQIGVNVQDTPEVAAAKIAHFNAVRQAAQAAIASGSNDDGSYLHSDSPVPVGPIVVSMSIPQTQQLVAVKDEAGVAPQLAGHYVQEVVYNPVYQANKIVSVPETNQHKLGVEVHDTPEVAAAKVAHFAAFRQAQLAAVDNESEKELGPQKNLYANTARQYGQVPY